MAFAAVLAAVRAAFAFGRFLNEKCSLLSNKSMSTRRSLSSNRLTSLTNPESRVKASEYSLVSIRSAASLASTRCLRKVRFSSRVHCTISLQSEICRSDVPGILATESIIPLTIFAVFALGIKEKKGLNEVRRLRRSSPRFSCLRRSVRFVMACSFIRRASGEEDGSSSTRYRIEIDSEWSLASNACAIDSVVAGRYDEDMASA
ncbi:hypothetical protein KIW84_050855, partial [Lathyrus oleraceus]